MQKCDAEAWDCINSDRDTRNKCLDCTVTATELNVTDCKCDRQKEVEMKILRCDAEKAEWDADVAEWSVSLIGTVRDLKVNEAWEVLTIIESLAATEWCRKLFCKLHAKWHWITETASESDSELSSHSLSWSWS